jgi:hypothetical protein
MKKAVHCFIFLMMFVLCVFFTSCKTTNNLIPAENAESVMLEVKQESDKNVPIKEIPVLGWNFFVKNQTAAKFAEMKEAGIEYSLSLHSNTEQLAKAMDAAKKAGVKLFINCPKLFTEPEKIVNRFKDHPALAGYYLTDEPNCIDFQHFGELVRRIQALDDKHSCYINLFPNYASSEQLGTSTYQEYVQLFLQEVPVPFLSFDHYPIHINASGVRSLVDVWYENLEIILDETNKAKKPFWAFALSLAHMIYPIPTIADLRLQVYSNFAYGAQGIQYFTYWAPAPDPSAWNPHDGPINYMNKKTQTWYKVQQINMEIKALSNVFLGAQVIQVRHIVKDAEGINEAIPIGTKRFDFAGRPKEANIIKTFTTTGKTKALVSFLKNGNRCYMLVVNCNLEGGDNMSVTIEGSEGLQLIKKYGMVISASSESSAKIITPGDVLIYGWDTNDVKY